MLKFQSTNEEEVVFIEEVTRKSKKGNEFTMVNLGLPNSYQTLEFFKDDLCDLSGLKKGDKVTITVGVQRNGFNQSYNLLNVKKVG